MFSPYPPPGTKIAGKYPCWFVSPFIGSRFFSEMEILPKMGKKVKVMKVDDSFSQIPPRVVAFILSFFECVVGEGGYISEDGSTSNIMKERTHWKEFDLFGFFKNDKMRNIWFLFTSLTIIVSSKCVVDISRLKILELYYASNLTILKTTKNASRFCLLEKLLASNFDVMEGDVPFDPQLLLSFPDSFPSLKSLKLDLSDVMKENNKKNVEIGSKWEFSKQFLTKFRSLVIYGPYSDDSEGKFTVSESIFTELSGGFLKKLSLIRISTVRKVTMECPRLESISLMHCKNLIVIPGNRLMKITMVNMDSEFFKAILENSPNLVNLGIVGIKDEEMKMSWLFEYSSNSSFKEKKLEKVFIRDCDFTGSSPLSTFGNLVRSITIVNCNHFVGSSILKNDYPFLEKLHLAQLPNLSIISENQEASCDAFPTQMKTLHLSEVDAITDEFFEKHHFHNLELLVLMKMGRISGEMWNLLPKLRTLHVERGSIQLGVGFDLFFRYQSSFFRLKELYFKDCDFFGSNWGEKDFPCLERIRIENASCLTDDMFSENNFPALKYLFLKHCGEELEGISWNPLKSLVTLTIFRCESFCDRFFQEQESKNLEVLSLHYSSCEGENWKFMEKLESFSTLQKDQLANNEDFLKNPPFGKSCCVGKFSFLHF